MYNEKDIIHSYVRFELESVLYNIGALHSYLGCLDKRSNDDVRGGHRDPSIAREAVFDSHLHLTEQGIKMSCTHFQQAAWAFQTIRDQYSPFGFSSDLNEDIMTFKFNVMLVSTLGQCQTCPS